MIVNAVFGVAGLLLLLFGLWLVWPPVMFIVAGLLLMALGLLREVVPDADAG